VQIHWTGCPNSATVVQCDIGDRGQAAHKIANCREALISTWAVGKGYQLRATAIAVKGIPITGNCNRYCGIYSSTVWKPRQEILFRLLTITFLTNEIKQMRTKRRSFQTNLSTTQQVLLLRVSVGSWLALSGSLSHIYKWQCCTSCQISAQLMHPSNDY